MKNIELRIHEIEIRANKDGLKVSGYVNKTNQLSEVIESSKRFVEKISKGAFDRAIRNAKEIHFLAEHDNKKILASTRNNSLTLREDFRGLFMEATITPTTYGSDYYQLIKSGILKNMSFGFRTIKDSWKQGMNGIHERTIEELELFEVSVVRDPAYSQSTIQARGIELVEDIKIPNFENEKEKLNKMKTIHRYNTSKSEIEIRKEIENREFNDNLRSLQMTSGNSSVIPQTVADMIVEKLDEISPVFARAKKFNSVSGSLKIPRETSMGIASFVGEGQNLVEDTMSLGEVKLEQKRVGAYVALTRQLINDSATQMEVYIPNLLAKRTFKAIEQSILRGTTAEEFRGIVPDESVQAFNLGSAASDANLLDTLLDMTLNIHPMYLEKSQFIMSRPFFNKVSKLKDGNGHFYVQNGIVNDKPSYTLFGLEVVISSALEGGDTVGQTPVVLGSLEDGYAVMVKKGAQMTMVQDTQHVLQGTVGFMFDVYLDGNVYNSDAFSKLVIA